MDRRLALRLTSLYPRPWRARYGDEFSAFLEDHPASAGVIVNVIGSACLERWRNAVWTMDWRQTTLTSMSSAYLAAVAAGVNFYFSLDDTRLALAMRGNVPMASAFSLIATGSFVAVAAVLALAAPVVFSVLRTAITTRKWDAAGRLTVPFAAAAITGGWLAANALVARVRWGGLWLPLPWNVDGEWPVPAGWPPLAIRVALSIVTLLLLLAGLVASAVSVSQAIARTDLRRQSSLWLQITAATLATSIVTMTIGVVSWGVFAERYAPGYFHARDGGFFTSTIFLSWIASAFVFAASASIALYGARTAIAGRKRPA